MTTEHAGTARRQGRTMGRIAVAVLFLLAALGAGSASAQLKPDGDTAFNAGLAHLKEGRPLVALEEFKRAVKVDPKNALYYKGLTVAYAQLADLCPPSDDGCRQDKLKESIAAARKGLELNPLYVDMHNDLGTALLKSGKRDEGKRELLTAFNDATNPTPEVTSRNLGQATFEERNYADAINWFRTSIARNKAYPDPYLGLADSLAATGRQDEALLALEAAVKEVPTHPGLLLALGEAYQRAGRLNDARARFEEAARKDPTGAAGRRAQDLLKGIPSR
jgi:tetratricopeptide (TPR) repeat protein